MSEVIYGDFEYEISLNMRIPLKWAEFIKRLGGNHYDYKCRQSAECGAVNGLVNVATWGDTMLPLRYRDLDTIQKIMEQAHLLVSDEHDTNMVNEINDWLRDAKDKINVRWAEI